MTDDLQFLAAYEAADAALLRLYAAAHGLPVADVTLPAALAWGEVKARRIASGAATSTQETTT